METPVMIRKTLAMACLLSISACDGGGGDSTYTGDYAGIWDVRYNLVSDSCQIVEAGLTGFVDSQSINQENLDITLDTSVGFGESLSGTLGEDNKFVAIHSINGDIYNDGIPCQVDQSISYKPTSDDRAETLFNRSILCADGFSCETSAVGEAKRR